MANIIKVKRGLKAALPTLNEGELAFTTDTHQVYIGDGTINHEVGSGDVAGPASSTDNNIALFDGATGKIIKDGGRGLTHAGTHVTGGGDTIADVVASGNSGLMSGTDKTKLDGITMGAIANVVEDTTPQLGGALDTNAKQIRCSKGADVPSANALTLGSDGNYFDITGTTTITSIGSLGIGTVVTLHFDGILILTHHATDLVLPGGTNITTAAGDEAVFIEYASGDWRCIVYTRASGQAVIAGDYKPGGTDVSIADGGTGASDAATAFSNIKQIATEGATGVLEKATTTEVVTGTDTDRAVTPAGVTARLATPGIIGGIVPSVGNFTQVKPSVNAETLSGTKTLLASDKMVQWLDPNGADRSVSLPAEEASTNLLYIILNTADGAGEDLVVKNDGGTTIATLGPGMAGMFSCEGTNWKYENDGGLFYDKVSGYRGIGTTTPVGTLDIMSSDAPTDQTPAMTADNAPSPNVVSSSGYGAPYYNYLAFDHVSGGSSAWVTYAASGWLRFDFGSGNEKVITSYSITAANSAIAATNSAPKNWTIEGSNDGSNYTTLATVTNETGWSSLEKRTYDITSPGSYRYYRINISANNGNGTYTSIGEMEYLIGTPAVHAVVSSTGHLGVGTPSPDQLFHAEKSSSITNTVQQVARLSHITSEIPTAGIGLGLEFEQETSANNNEVIATIEAVTTDVTATSEGADLVFKTMAAGAAATECARLSPTGISFFGVAKQVKQAHIADPTDLAACISAITSILSVLEGYGLLATS